MLEVWWSKNGKESYVIFNVKFEYVVVMIEEEKYNCKYSKKFGISWLLLITIFLLRNIYIYIYSPNLRV